MLLEQLQALEAATCDEPWEVIVVDNGFSKSEKVGDSLARFHETLPGFTVVPAFEGKGAGYARNVGCAVAKGDKLAFLDADDVAGEGWLPAMARALDEHAIVASRWDIDLLNEPVMRAARKNGQATGVRHYKRPNYLDHAGGCGLGVQREAFERVGGFDERFLLLEDTDLTWRLQLAGYELAFAPDALVHIRFRRTSHGSFKQAYGYGKYNALLYKTYRSRGMPKLTFTMRLRAIGALITNSIQLLDPRRRQKFLRSLGFQIGRIGGSIAYVIWGI